MFIVYILYLYTDHIFLSSLQGRPIEKQLQFKPAIHAFDQDLGINASLQYSILRGKCLLQN